MRKLVFDDDMSSYPGPLSVVLSLLTSSWITLDLQAHQELLKVGTCFIFKLAIDNFFNNVVDLVSSPFLIDS